MLAERAKSAHSGLTGSGVIAGSVAGFDGQSIAGACVTAVGAGHSITTSAAPDGTFQLAGLPAGSYALEYRDCAAAGRYLTTWSGGVSWQSAAARVQVAAGQLRRVSAMTLTPVNLVAAIAAEQASFQRRLAANNRILSATAAAKTGEISGTVTGKGKLLSGICVQASEVSSGQFFDAKTSRIGTYAIRALSPGRYNVTFAPILFCPNRTNWLQQVYKNNNSISVNFNGGGKVLTVTAGHKLSGINGNLRLGGEISGTVTGKSGAKARGICVTAQAKFPHGLNFGFGNQTAANGTYQFHAMFPGRYTLHFNIGCGSRSENYAPVRHPTVTLRLAQHITVNQVLPTGASISGTVTLTTSSGQPLKGICVYVSNASGSSSAFTSTNREGGYRAIGLTGGTFQLQFSPDCINTGNYTSVTVTAHTTAGQQTSNVNAVLQVGAEISGTIKNTGGNPVSGICIEVDSNNAAADYGGFDNGGTYVINQLSAGTYQVGFTGGCGNTGSYAPNWYSGQPSQNTATPVTLTTGENFPVDVVMQPGATITGKVTNTHGNALNGACVDAVPQFYAELSVLAFESQAVTRHGTYTLSNLAPGQYLINFSCPFGQQKYASQWFPDAPDVATADAVSAPAGKTSGINAVVQPEGSISGMVTGQGGNPLTGICVSAVNTKGALPALHGSGGASFLSASVGVGFPILTGANGSYSIKGLAAGRYHVSFTPCSGSTQYAEQWYRDKSSATAATDVTVRALKITTGIDAHLVVGGSISGHVTGPGGQPERNICVIAAAGSAGPVGFGVTGKAGTYSITGLASGRYTVEFSTCGNDNLTTAVTQALVTAPHATSGVNAALQVGGSIAGTVTAGTASGQPVSDTCVEVYGTGPEPVGAAFTGLDGSYRVEGLPAGSYQVLLRRSPVPVPGPGPGTGTGTAVVRRPVNASNREIGCRHRRGDNVVDRRGAATRRPDHRHCVRRVAGHPAERSLRHRVPGVVRSTVRQRIAASSRRQRPERLHPGGPAAGPLQGAILGRMRSCRVRNAVVSGHGIPEGG